MTSSTGTDVSRETSAAPEDRPAHLARTVDAATMESELAAFKDPKLARGLIESIAKLSPAGGATLMEVWRHAHRRHRAQRHPQPHARGHAPRVGSRLPRVRDLEQGYRHGHRPRARSGRHHRHVRRHDARAGLHVQPAGRAGGGPQRADRVLAAGRAHSGPAEPRSRDRVRGRGLRNHHAAGGHGHQARGRGGPQELQRVRRA